MDNLTGIQERDSDLPIVERTQYLRIRSFEGRKVLTFRDIAEAYNVLENNVRQAFVRHQGKWVEACDNMSQPLEVETMQVSINTAGGKQDVRLFTLRGAMRFAFHIRSGLADTIQNHLLDLWQKERNSEPKSTIPSWADQLANATLQLNQFAVQTAERIQIVENKLESLPSRVALQVKQDLQALDQRKVRLKHIVALIVQRARVLPEDHGSGKHYRSWRSTYNAVFAAADPPVSKLAAFTTKTQLNKAIEFAEIQLTMLGVAAPPDQQELFID